MSPNDIFNTDIWFRCPINKKRFYRITYCYVLYTNKHIDVIKKPNSSCLKFNVMHFFKINTDLIKIDVLDLQIGSICNPDEAFICAFSHFYWILNIYYYLNYFGITIVRGGQRVVAFMVNPRPQTCISTNLHSII